MSINSVKNSMIICNNKTIVINLSFYRNLRIGSVYKAKQFPVNNFTAKQRINGENNSHIHHLMFSSTDYRRAFIIKQETTTDSLALWPTFRARSIARDTFSRDGNFAGTTVTDASSVVCQQMIWRIRTTQLNRFYNVTSLVHSYIVITVFLGLVSGLLLVHSGAF